MVTKFKVGTILTCHTRDGQAHTIGKAIRPLFADPVTFVFDEDKVHDPEIADNSDMEAKFHHFAQEWVDSLNVTRFWKISLNVTLKYAIYFDHSKGITGFFKVFPIIFR